VVFTEFPSLCLLKIEQKLGELVDLKDVDLCGLLAVGVVLPLMRQVAMSSCHTSDTLALNQAEDKDVIQSLVDRLKFSNLSQFPCCLPKR
jgi:hypothetical protein